MKINQRGQAMIESLAAMMAMVCLFLVISGSCFLYLVHTMVGHVAHEALVCRLSHSESAGDYGCESSLRRKIERWPFGVKVQAVIWSQTKRKISVRVQLEPLQILGHRTDRLEVTKNFALPLAFQP